MVWIYLAELVDSQKLWKDTLDRSLTVKTTDTLKPSFFQEWQVENSQPRRSGTMSKHSPQRTLPPPKLSMEDFPVKIFRLLDAERAWMESEADYFSRSSDLQVKYNRDSSSWKMCQLFGLEEPTLLSESWPTSGMTRDGSLYRLQKLEPTIAENAGGFWQTPNVPNGGRVNPTDMTPGGKMPNGKKRQVGLEHQVRMVENKMWPTPRAEHDSGKHNGKPDTLHSAVKMWPTPRAEERGQYQRDRGIKGKERPTLAGAVKMWPTPLSTEGSGGAQDPAKRRAGGHTPKLRDEVGGQLNPQWVEWLMGYPQEWTALEPWAMQWFRPKRAKRLKG